ncbi:lipopolysaccharide biosynthesis protein [Zafaria cholistanensis]|uniref:lipopolysaccharide biosynthesis protein n=1 Tax=Zafaria cholistanensis TaxID=1682741 RepID=UPI001231093F|nr:hypothetical protein [Zafaria cholistanensis]
MINPQQPSSDAEPFTLEEGQNAVRSRAMRSALISGMGAKVATTLLGFISVGIAVRVIGPVEYGIVATLVGLTGALGFLDFGIGNAAITVAARHYSTGSWRDLRKFVLNTFGFLSLVGFLALMSLGTMVLVFPDEALLPAEGVDPSDIRYSILLFVVSSAMSIPLTLGSRLALAYQKGWQANLVMLGASVLTFVSCYIGSLSAQGLLYFTACFVIFPVLLNGMLTVIQVKRTLSLADGWRDGFSVRDLKGVLLGGAPFMVLSVATAAFSQGQSLVVAYVVGASGAALYGLVSKLFVGTMSLFSNALLQLWASTSHALAQRDVQWVRRTFSRMFALTMTVYGVVSVLLIAFGGIIIDIWTGSLVAVSRWDLFAFALWSLYSFGMSQFSMLLNGANRIWLQAALNLMVAGAAVPLAIHWSEKIGIVGVPYANLVAHLVFLGIPTIFAVRKVLRT